MPAEPRILTEDELVQLEALASVLSSEQIADYFGIARSTFYDIMNRQDDVSGRYKKGRAKAIGSIAKSLLQKAQNGDNVAMIFYLKTQAGWKETISTENKNIEMTHEEWLDSLK
jgi:IS30 family transposase